MRRTALAVAALLLAAPPVLAAGVYVTRNVNDGSGTHLQTYFDESGVGNGPFDPVVQLPAGAASSGGGSTALAPSDASGSIASANTFQTAIPANAARKACTIQNPSTATENLLVYDRSGTPTAANAYTLAPGQTYSCNGPGGIVTSAIQLAAPTVGHAFVGSAQ